MRIIGRLKSNSPKSAALALFISSFSLSPGPFMFLIGTEGIRIVEALRPGGEGHQAAYPLAGRELEDFGGRHRNCIDKDQAGRHVGCVDNGGLGGEGTGNGKRRRLKGWEDDRFLGDVCERESLSVYDDKKKQ